MISDGAIPDVGVANTMLYTDWDIYVAFRNAQGTANDRGYRLPKDWSAQRAKMKKTSLEYLDRTVGIFNTALSNIDIDKYMKCGFEIFKTFNYHMFLNKKVLNLYIQRDKIEKRSILVNKEKIVESVRFIKNYMKGVENRKGYNTLETYCKLREGSQKVVIGHYKKGHIDNITMVYFINNGYLVLDDDERHQVIYLINRYRDFIEVLKTVKSFLTKVEVEI